MREVLLLACIARNLANFRHRTVARARTAPAKSVLALIECAGSGCADALNNRSSPRTRGPSLGQLNVGAIWQGLDFRVRGNQRRLYSPPRLHPEQRRLRIGEV